MSLWCKLGLHDWEPSGDLYGGTAHIGYMGKIVEVSAVMQLEKCSRCPAERGTVNTGFMTEHCSADLLRQKVREFEVS